jgi:predicted DNA-binding protein (MmcQ/YjbR family)
VLRAKALAYPEAIEDFPWGHSAFKVNKRIFMSMGRDEQGCRMSFKLPASRYEALMFAFTEPTHYGMGKHGWVTATLDPDADAPLELLLDWLDESYRSIAPKRLVAGLDQ